MFHMIANRAKLVYLFILLFKKNPLSQINSFNSIECSCLEKLGRQRNFWIKIMQKNEIPVPWKENVLLQKSLSFTELHTADKKQSGVFAAGELRCRWLLLKS